MRSFRRLISVHALLLLFSGPCWPTVWSVPTPHSTIQAAIDLAASGDTVLVADGTYTGIGNRDLDFDDKDIYLLSVNGPEVTIIDCQNLGQGFQFLPLSGDTGAPIIDGFTFENGTSTFYGGAAVISDGSPTIRNCHFRGNESTVQGGAIRMGDTGEATFERCVFSGNKSFDGGAIMQNVLGTSLTIRGCTFSGNEATNDGGALYIGNGVSVDIDSTIIWNNCAGGAGPDVRITSTSTADFACSVIDTAQMSIEGIGSFTESDTNIIGADPIFLQEIVCLDAPQTAGDFRVNAGSPALVVNSPCGSRIGALGRGGDVVIRVPADKPSIQAAVDSADGADTVLVAPGIYTGTDNRSIHFDGKHVVLLSEGGPDSTIIDGDFMDPIFSFPFSDTTEAVIEGLTLRHGQHTIAGAANVTDAAPTFRDCYFLGNVGTNQAGAVRVHESATFEYCLFSGNQSVSGGALLIGDPGATATVNHCTFVANEATTGSGGAIYISNGAHLRLDTTVVWGNCASFGNDIRVTFDASMDFSCCVIDTSQMALLSATINFLDTNIFGVDPLFIEQDPCDDAPDAENIFGNYRVSAVSPCMPAINGCGTQIGAFGRGVGARYPVPLTGLLPTIQAAIDSAAAGDTVEVADGVYSGPGNTGLSMNNKAIVVRSTDGSAFTTIDCERSGRGFLVENSNSATIQGFTILEADVNAGDGGGMLVTSSQITLRDCAFRRNRATNGAALAVVAGSVVDLFDCTFLENQAGGVGGGVFVDGLSTTNATDCTVADNFATDDGGGISIDNANLDLTGCTVAFNFAGDSGGGLHGTSTPLIIFTNTIVWGNGGATDPEIGLATGTASFICCIVDTFGITPGSSVNYISDIVVSDPLFIGPLGHDYRLASNSPAVAANSPCGIQIGANGDAGIGGLVVWDGGGDGVNWNDPVNWTGDVAPTINDFVQISLTAPDTVFAPDITPGVGPGLIQARALTLLDDDSNPATQTGVLAITESLEVDQGVRVTGSLLFPATVGGTPGGTLFGDPAFGVEVEPNGMLTAKGGKVSGYATFSNSGTVTVQVGDTLGFTLNVLSLVSNDRDTTTGVVATLTVSQGDLVIPSAPLVNTANAFLINDADIRSNDNITNGPGGIFNFAGTAGAGEVLGGSGDVDNFGQILMTGTHSASFSVPVNNLITASEADTGFIDIQGGALSFGSAVINDGRINVASGGTIDLQGAVANRLGAFIDLAGDGTGSGIVTNTGTVIKTGSGTSSFTPPITNVIDSTTNMGGLLHVQEGTLNASSVINKEVVNIGEGASLGIIDTLLNSENALVKGSGTLDLQGGMYNAGRIEPGASPDTLHFTGDFSMEPSAEIEFEIGGLVAGVDHDLLEIGGGASFSGAINVRYINGFVPAEGNSFEIITYSAGSPFAATDFTCFSGLEGDSIYLIPVQEPTRYLLVAIDTSFAPENSPPVATEDSDTTIFDPVTVFPLDNDSDPDFDPLTIAAIRTTGMVGGVSLDLGDTSVTYIPPLTFTGRDTLTYFVTDCAGGVDSSIVVFRIGDAVSVGETVPPSVPGILKLWPNTPNPFNPLTRLRFDIPTAGHVSLYIYDIRGRLIRELYDGPSNPGHFETAWAGRDEEGRSAPSGVYFVRLQSGRDTDTRKIVLIR